MLAAKKREEANKLRLAKECVESSKYEPNFIDEDNLVELNLHGDLSEDIIARANFILEEKTDEEKFRDEIGAVLNPPKAPTSPPPPPPHIREQYYRE